jgi:DNA helicase-2/ATP-dependent DNA helicase PcrA
MTAWRGGSQAAEEGWVAAGIKPAKKPEPMHPLPSRNAADYEQGMVVKHAKYGRGRIMEVSGYGATRRIKVRFSTQGVVTFVASMAKLEIV